MKSLVLYISILLLSVNTGMAETYNYITAEQLKEKMSAGEELIIVDIQVKEEFEQHHLPGSVATYAYPVKSESERAAINQAVETYHATGKPVVIVCPRGKGGAKRCYDYMNSQNIPKEKLTILEKGMAGWPYKELLEGQ